jgi:hypothetical protein
VDKTFTMHAFYTFGYHLKDYPGLEFCSILVFDYFSKFYTLNFLIHENTVVLSLFIIQYFHEVVGAFFSLLLKEV